jgi:hypothetical protein
MAQSVMLARYLPDSVPKEKRTVAPSIPTINMSAAPASLAVEIGNAARGVGFFYVAGHAIDLALMEAVFAGSRRTRSAGKDMQFIGQPRKG